MNKTLSAEYCLENKLVILSSKDDLVQIGHLDEIEREKPTDWNVIFYQNRELSI